MPLAAAPAAAYRGWMPNWLRDIGGLLLVGVCVQIMLATMLGGTSPLQRRLWHAVVRLAGRVRPPSEAVVVPLRRPIEQIAADLRRLHQAFHRGGMRFAKYEGCRLAYDGVLAEAAETLEIDHLLGVLPAGGERDHERERVEQLLDGAGLLRRPHAA